nr:GntR family transcriptional regulator [Zhihengliuella flava]
MKTSIAEAIRDGVLVSGQKLPAVRALAGQLGVAVNTVARVYKELESDGLVDTLGRAGTRVAQATETFDAELTRAAEAYAAVALKWAQGPDEAAARLSAAMERLRSQ